MRPSSTTATGEGRRRASARSWLRSRRSSCSWHSSSQRPCWQSPRPAPSRSSTGDTGEQTIVDGEPEVCTFAVIFDFDEAFPIVGWKIKDWVPGNWKDGETHLKGQGATDGDGRMRIPSTGFFTLVEGRYNVVADDEWPIDGSSKVQSFHVICPESTEPTPPDDGGEAPATDTPGGGGEPGETGGVGAATGRPRITLPPTDGGIATVVRAPDSRLPVVGLGLLTIVVLLLTPRHLRNRR